MSPALIASLRPDTDDTAELFIKVTHQQFSGESSAWFNLLHLRSFGEQLAEAYPLDPSNPLMLQGGYWQQDGKSLKQLHVGLSFYPIGGTGTVGIHVRLASPLLAGDRLESQKTLSVELSTNYEELRHFAKALVALTLGTATSAKLSANEA